MRWSIIRLIWLRELRDQLRDRRTVIMMAVLPLLLYPALGFGVLQFALSYAGRPNVVGIYGAENLTPTSEEPTPADGLAASAGLWVLPAPGGNGLDPIATGAAI